MTKKKNKIFILDTNVILHDSTCIENFEDNKIVIPISVLEELDQFKRGHEQVHYNAREFLRKLDELSNDSEEKKLKKINSKISVVVNHNWHPDVKTIFNEDFSINLTFEDSPNALDCSYSRSTDSICRS